MKRKLSWMLFLVLFVLGLTSASLGGTYAKDCPTCGNPVPCPATALPTDPCFGGAATQPAPQPSPTPAPSTGSKPKK